MMLEKKTFFLFQQGSKSGPSLFISLSRFIYRRETLRNWCNADPMVITRRQVAAGKRHDDEDSTATNTTVNTVDTESDVVDANDVDVVADANDAPTAAAAAIPRAKSKTWGLDFWKRLISGLFLSAFFVSIIRGGHIWVCIGVILMEVCIVSLFLLRWQTLIPCEMDG